MEEEDGVVQPDDTNSNCEYTLIHIFIWYFYPKATYSKVLYKPVSISVREKGEGTESQERKY